MKLFPRSLLLSAIVEVSQSTTAPDAAEYPVLAPPSTMSTPSDTHVPVRSPVSLSRTSPESSTWMWTSLGRSASRLTQNSCTDSTAVAVSRKYIVVMPGAPMNPVHTDRTLEMSTMIAPNRPIQNLADLAALGLYPDGLAYVFDSRPPAQYPEGYSLCQVQRQLTVDVGASLWSLKGRRTPLRGESGAQRPERVCQRSQDSSHRLTMEVCRANGEGYLAHPTLHPASARHVLDHHSDSGGRLVRP